MNKSNNTPKQFSKKEAGMAIWAACGASEGSKQGSSNKSGRHQAEAMSSSSGTSEVGGSGAKQQQRQFGRRGSTARRQIWAKGSKQQQQSIAAANKSEAGRHERQKAVGGCGKKGRSSGNKGWCVMAEEGRQEQRKQMLVWAVSWRQQNCSAAINRKQWQWQVLRWAVPRAGRRLNWAVSRKKEEAAGRRKKRQEEGRSCRKKKEAAAVARGNETGWTGG